MSESRPLDAGTDQREALKTDRIKAEGDDFTIVVVLGLIDEMSTVAAAYKKRMRDKKGSDVPARASGFAGHVIPPWDDSHRRLPGSRRDGTVPV